MGEGRNVYRVSMGKSEGKRPLERPRHRWEDGLKWILGRLAGGMWTGFAWLRIGAISRLL
jgi:hypothetical protein